MLINVTEYLIANPSGSAPIIVCGRVMTEHILLPLINNDFTSCFAVQRYLDLDYLKIDLKFQSPSTFFDVPVRP